MSSPLTFPPLVQRLIKGAELTFAEGDANLVNIRAFCEALANLVAGTLNPDGTLVANSVGAAAIQAAAVQFSNLNPALFYSIVPVDNDIGTIQGSYAITARGGVATGNLLPGGAVYDVNGNYTYNGLTLNYGYYWTKGANDASCESSPPLTVSNPFTALSTSIVLTGTPAALVTASLVQSAPINAYQDGMMFFVYTATTNNGAATLNVNNLGAIPIKLYGQGLATGMIQGPGVFAVVYKSGNFILFSGGAAAGGSGSGTVVTTTGYSGLATFTTPAAALNTGSYPNTITTAHGLGALPSLIEPVLVCISADSGFAVGQLVPLSEFKGSGGAAQAYSWAADASNIYLTELATPYTINPSSNSLVAITKAKWNLQAVVSATSNFAGVAAFPALTYQVANPMGAFSYSNFLYTFSQSKTSNSSKYYINQINLLTNEVLPVSQPASSLNYSDVNGAVFGVGFFATPTFIFCCSDSITNTNGGIFTMTAINPGNSIISGGTAYNSSGAASTPTMAIGTYTWTPGANDISIVLTGGGGGTYLAANAVNGQVTIVVAGSTAVGAMTGAPGTVITGTLISGSGGWSVAQFSLQLKCGAYKPVWYNASDPLTSGVATVYAALSGTDSTLNTPLGYTASVSAIKCYQVTSAAKVINGTWATNNAADLDLTSSNIVGVAAFNSWYPAGSNAKVLLFQYNPVLKRIYVICDELALMHIFTLSTASNDFSAWWNTASPTRAQKLAYTKSLAIGGDGAPQGTAGQCHYTVEYDPATGKEKAIVLTRDGSGTVGTVTRIPWNE